MKNVTRYAWAVPFLAVAAIAVASTASAHGLWQDPAAQAEAMETRFEQEAALLGTDVGTVKEAWADGKTVPQLAEDLGLSPDDLNKKIQEMRKADREARLSAMVSAGIITQDQADRRTAFMETQGEGGGWGHGGWRLFRGPGIIGAVHRR